MLECFPALTFLPPLLPPGACFSCCARKRIAWALLIYACSVSLATIYGRYHYTADVLAGIGISVLAGAICWWGLSREARPTP